MTSIETVIRDAQAIIANGHTSSPDFIVPTVKVLAWLFFLKYYEQHRHPSRLSPAAVQEINEYKNNLDTTLAQINLSDDEYQRLLHLVDTLLPQEQPSTHRDDEISHFYSNLLELLTPHNKATGVLEFPRFWRVGEEKYAKLKRGGFYGQISTGRTRPLGCSRTENNDTFQCS